MKSRRRRGVKSLGKGGAVTQGFSRIDDPRKLSIQEYVGGETLRTMRLHGLALDVSVWLAVSLSALAVVSFAIRTLRQALDLLNAWRLRVRN